MVSGNLRLRTQTAPLYIFAQFEAGNVAEAQRRGGGAGGAVVRDLLLPAALLGQRERSPDVDPSSSTSPRASAASRWSSPPPWRSRTASSSSCSGRAAAARARSCGMIAGLTRAGLRAHLAARPRRHRPAAPGARDRLRVPELLDLPPHERGGEHRVPAEDPQACRRRARAAARGAPRPAWASAASATATPTSSRAASSSGWRSPGALVHEPSVLLLDEPFGALDVKIRAQLRRNLREIQRQLGVTAILVTHDQEEAFELADRIGLMERGELLEVGEPEELYARPRTLFGATFLGAGTVLVGRARDGAAQLGAAGPPHPARGASTRRTLGCGCSSAPSRSSSLRRAAGARGATARPRGRSSSGASSAPCGGCGCACRPSPVPARRRPPSTARRACWSTPCSPPRRTWAGPTSG